MADKTIPGSIKVESRKLTGVRKRQQIEVANRTMFLAVVFASIALSFTIASGQYLFSKWQFNNKIISAKYTAARTLEENIQTASQLEQAVLALEANQELASVKTDPEDSNLKSVLDALPTEINPAALATSLQERILSKSGATIESITVPAEVETQVNNFNPVPQEMLFSFVISGSYEQIKNTILDIERTIRPIKLTNIDIEGSGSGLRATFEATTYYQWVRSNLVSEETIR